MNDAQAMTASACAEFCVLRSAFRVSPRRSRRGIGILDTLIVVVIMSILAATAIPQLSDSIGDAQDAVLMKNLQAVRGQIEVFKLHHLGHSPGWNGVDPLTHLSMYSDEEGKISASPSASYPYGPYLRPTEIVNPFNNGYQLQQSSTPAKETPDPNLLIMGKPVGWFYNPNTGRIAANAPGSTAGGIPRIAL